MTILCNLFAQAVANATSILTADCTLLQCLLKLVVDLLWNLLCVLIGLAKQLIITASGTAAGVTDTTIPVDISNAITAIINAICTLTGCILNKPLIKACFSSPNSNSLSYIKSRLICIFSELNILGIGALNTALVDIQNCTSQLQNS